MADFTTEVNKPLVELLVRVKMDQENQDEIEDKVVGKIFKLCFKIVNKL